MRVVLIMLPLLLGIPSGSFAQEPPSTVRGGRIFELRTYYANPGKLEALHARFRNHTSKLFEKHGMTIVGYWVPIDGASGAATGNTLVYILSYPSIDARKRAWDAFDNDPDWVSARTESEKDGKLVEKVDSVFLAPTDYSPLH
jgi:hypothetical protein